MADLDFRILGSLEVVRAGEPVPLGGAKQRAVLALLLLNSNRVLSTDAIADALWPREAPTRLDAAVQRYVSEIRELVCSGTPSETITTELGGYRLRIAPHQLDLHRFEAYVQRGRQAVEERQLQEAHESLTSALGLYRGDPLLDFADQDWARLECARLEELRLACLEDLIDVELGLGRHATVVGELEALIALNPLRERLRGQLMLALYRSGRQSEALAAYRSAHTTFAEEFGLEPTQGLRDLEQAILRQDASLMLELDGGRVGRHQTLLFTDIEGSTRLLQRLGDRYGAVLVEHRRLLADVVAAKSGRVVDSYGDGFFASFSEPADALRAAAAAQHALAGHPWPEDSPVLVRMGVHTGEPAAIGSGLVGLDVHRVARLCGAAHGGQVLVSNATAAVLGGAVPDGLSLRDLGEHHLRDLSDPERLFQLVIPGLTDRFPPPRSDSKTVPIAPHDRAILVVGDRGVASSSLVGIGETLARSHIPHELIVARLVEPQRGECEHSRSLARVTEELFRMKAELGGRGVSARVAAFTSDATGEDAGRLAGELAVDLLLTSRTVEELDGDEFDVDLVELLAQAPCHVAVCTAGAAEISSVGETVVVPFGGAEHDWAALELGAWMAGALRRRLRLLGVEGNPALGQRDASRLLASASLAVQQLVGVPTEPELVPAGAESMLRVAEHGGLIVAGVPGDWRARGLGQLRRALVRAGANTIFVRRGVRPGALAPRGSQTRFSWSIADVAAD